SPRTWGWSVQARAGEQWDAVLPTHVGMVRAPARSPGPPRGAPHARGDGPHTQARGWTEAQCSPRTWGWSITHYVDGPDVEVLPTHVGMVRIRTQRFRTSARAP